MSRARAPRTAWRNQLRLLLCACLLLLAHTLAGAAEPPALPFLPTTVGEAGFPGGIVRVPLPAGTTEARSAGRPVLRHGDVAIVGIPLAAAQGTGQVEAVTPAGTVTITYRIEPRFYPEQRLTIANPRMVDPLPEDLARIEREQLEIDAARDRFTPAAPATLSLAAPVRGPLSSPFGTRRVFNGQPRNPHNGLDFAAPTGAPVVAPLAGEVAGVGNYFFTGNTVFLDHGQGFVTMYCHLSRVDVQPGAVLREGDAIGRVGATGRATGPHLHWAVYLGNVAVDPKLLLRTPARAR